MHLAVEHVTTKKEEPSTEFWAECPSVGQEPIFPGPQAAVPEASPFTGITPRPHSLCHHEEQMCG